MDWLYDSRARYWRSTVGAWEARVEQWPASLEYVAQLISPAPERQIIHAPHVFAQLETAQAWCLCEIAGQDGLPVELERKIRIVENV